MRFTLLLAAAAALAGGCDTDAGSKTGSRGVRSPTMKP